VKKSTRKRGLPETGSTHNAAEGKQLPESVPTEELPGLHAVQLDKIATAGLSHHLHELLNLLWSASICIELAITEENCTPEIRGHLEDIGKTLDDAMKLTAQADKHIEAPQQPHPHP
jgi:hypothetical protein